MVTDFQLISSGYKTQLDAIEKNNVSTLTCANKAIILSRNILCNFKKEIQNNGFESSEREIDFFKYIKQIPLSPLIYYSEVRSFELQFPKANVQSQKKFINKKLVKLNRFFTHNLDFIQYIENGHTHFDLQYYTREYLDSFHIVSSKFYFQDPDFTTARDMLLAKVKAYQKLIPYLQNRLKKPYKNGVKNGSANGHAHQLKWTASKTALTELIYALHSYRVINNGNVGIKEIAKELQNVLHFDLGDFYKTFSEIKSRKISRTKFLDDLSASLITQMDKSEN